MPGAANPGLPPASKDFTSQHRVKKILEMFHGTAKRTLTGPATRADRREQLTLAVRALDLLPLVHPMRGYHEERVATLESELQAGG